MAIKMYTLFTETYRAVIKCFFQHLSNENKICSNKYWVLIKFNHMI